MVQESHTKCVGTTTETQLNEMIIFMWKCNLERETVQAFIISMPMCITVLIQANSCISIY